MKSVELSLVLLLFVTVFSGCIGSEQKPQATVVEPTPEAEEVLETTAPVTAIYGVGAGVEDKPVVPTLPPPPSPVNAKASFYSDLKIVPLIEGYDLGSLEYTKIPPIGDYRGMMSLMKYNIKATYYKGTQTFDLEIQSLAPDGVKAYISQMSEQSQIPTQIPTMEAIQKEGVMEKPPPPPALTITPKTIGGVTVYFRNSTSYSFRYINESAKAIMTYYSFEYKWLKDSVSYSIRGSGYNDPLGKEVNPANELASIVEKIIGAPSIAIKNYNFLAMKEYLPEPPSNWNLYNIQVLSSAPPFTPPPGSTGVTGTYAKEPRTTQYGGSELKDIKVTILFGFIQRPELGETSNFLIAGKNVSAGYTYTYEHMAVERQETRTRQEKPPEPVKTREKYNVILVDNERLAVVFTGTKADLQSEHESTMRQFMTDIINAIYK